MNSDPSLCFLDCYFRGHTKAQFQAQAVAAQEAATAAAVASAADASAAATTAGYWGKVEPGFTANHDR